MNVLAKKLLDFIIDRKDVSLYNVCYLLSKENGALVSNASSSLHITTVHISNFNIHFNQPADK